MDFHLRNHSLTLRRRALRPTRRRNLHRILYQDPVTHAPTYALEGFMWRNPPRTGKWTILKGTPIDSNAVVYQLDPDDPQGFLSFVKADDNILFFLDKDRNLLIGNIKHSYALNRVGR